MTRVVIDTNVWVSGLLWTGSPWRILRLAEDEEIEVWATVSMLEELEAVLSYPRLQPRRKDMGLEIADLMAYATALVSLVELARIEPVVAAGAGLHSHVHCAIAVGAEYLISGDKHLLNLVEWRGIPIVTPQVFLEEEFPQLIEG